MIDSSFKPERDVVHYNDWAPTYEDSKVQRIRNDIHQSLVDWAASSGIQPKRILDVGCGTGALLRRVGPAFPDAELNGVDISPNMVKEASRKVPKGLRVHFLQGPAEKLPFEDGSFDLVVTTICFHHWRSRVEGIAEVHRVLAPGGRFYIADHFAIGWLRALFIAFRCRDRCHTPRELNRMLRDAGFSVQGWKRLYKLWGWLPLIQGVVAEKRP